MFFFVLRNGYFCGDLDIPKEARSHKNVGRQFDHGSKFQTLPPTPKQFSLEAWERVFDGTRRSRQHSSPNAQLSQIWTER